MAQRLDHLIQEIRNDLATLPGLQRVHFDVPDDISRTPAIVVYPMAGRWELGTHSGDTGKPMRWAMHTIRIELHVDRIDLSRDMDVVMEFCDNLPDWLFAGFKRDKFNGTMVLPGDPHLANNAVAPIRYSVIEMAWGADQHIGWRLEFDVSTESEINV